MISAVYPFWFNVARQTGRLLALQDQVTQRQIINRLKEQYGDRQTVSRQARFVIRSRVAWGILKDSDTCGCYEKAAPVSIAEPNLAIPEAQGTWRVILSHPAFFPFQCPVMTGEGAFRHSDRINVVWQGVDDELMSLKRH